MEGSTGTRQYLTQPTTRVPINESKFQWPLLNEAPAAHVVGSIGRKTMNLIFHVTNVWFHFPAFPCIPRWLVPFPRISTYDWFHFLNFPIWLTTSRWWWFLRSDHHSRMVSPPRLVTPRWCGSSALTITAEWPLLPDWQHPGDMVHPLWPSQLNGLSTQTGSTQVMWFLRSDHHSWMVSPPGLVTPRWCGSSALTVTAEWSLHPDWQHPGDVVPPLWPSQLSGV